MDRVHQADDNQVERVAALEEYLTLARADGGETWFDAGAWSEDLADSYLALGLSLPSREDAPRGGRQVSTRVHTGGGLSFTCSRMPPRVPPRPRIAGDIGRWPGQRSKL